MEVGMFLKPNRKMSTTLIVAILLVALGVVAAFWSFGQVRQTAEARKHTYKVIILAQELLSDLQDAETGQRGYLLTGDEAFLEPYLAVRETLDGTRAELRKLTTIEQALSHLDAMSPHIDEKVLDLSQTIELRRQNEMPAVLKRVSAGDGIRMMDAIRAEMKSFIQIQEDSLAQHDLRLQSSMRRLFAIIILASLSTLLFSLGYVYVYYQELRNRIDRAVHMKTQHLLEAQQAVSTQLQEASVTLQASKEQLAVTLSSIGDAVIATDMNGRVTLLNPIAEQLTGWSLVEAANRPIDEVFHIINKETRQLAVIPVHDTLSLGTIHGLANHTVLIARQGSESDIADSCAPIRNREGQVIGAVLVFRDVTEDYAVQQALRDSQSLVQAILNTVEDGIITFQASDGVVQTVNPAATRMFGYSAPELIGQNLTLVIPSHDPRQSESSLQTYSTSEEDRASGIGREVVGRRQDGSSFPLEIAVSDMSQRGQRYFTGSLRDLTARKRAETALLEAGALQSAIFNSANFSSIATDEKGVIQIFNVGAERMLGYTAAEVMNKITPADISDPKEVIARASTLSLELGTEITPGFEALVFKASRGIEDIYELTYIRKDGSRFPAVVSVTALRDASGAIIGYLLIGTDNTARKRAETALLEAGALQSAIFNSANFSSIATDEKGVIQIFNVGAERMLGYTASEVMNKITPADISDPQEVIARAKALSSELSTSIAPGFEALVFKASRGIEDIYELTYIRKDGTRFPALVSVTALRNAQNGIIGYLLIGTDNTVRKQVEGERMLLDQRVRDQQFYTRSLIEANIDALMTTDPRGIISDVNKQMEALTGCTRDELIGAPFKDYFTNSERAEAGINRVLAEGKVTDYELTARSRDGRETVVSYNATTFYDRDRKLQGVFAAARDVTERSRFEVQMREQAAKLSDLHHRKDEFLAMLSHELRSPLAPIANAIQLLGLQKGSESLIQQQARGIIERQMGQLQHLVDDLLEMSRITTGRVQLRKERVAVDGIVQGAIETVRPLIEQRGHEITVSLPADPIWLNADAARLEQVVVNLLTNAAKYTEEGGQIWLTVQQEGDECVLRVRDTGVGITPELLPCIFDLFTQAERSLDRSQGGLGIGLALVQRLTDLHGGTVEASSVLGQGSEFMVRLPIMSDETRVTGRGMECGNSQSGGEPTLATPLRVLVVDDNVDTVLSFSMLLQASGHEVRTAHDGLSAVQAALDYRPDVMLLDIGLPGLNGYEVAKQVRQRPELKSVVLVALTGYGQESDRTTSMQAGFNHHMVKPASFEQIKLILASVPRLPR
jgi:PAS domain S-box-containing protein